MSDETNPSLDTESAAQAYSDALKRSLEELRKEVDARLSSSREELTRLIGDFEASLPELPEPEPPPEPAPEPLPAIAAEGSPGDSDTPTLEEVASSLVEIEGADSQPELLARLVEQASLFASRTLLLLPATGDTLRCWASLGFGGAGTMLENLDLTRPQSAAWSDFAQGARELDSEHCRALSDAVSVAPPTRGALVPLELRGQVLAILYADQLETDRFSMSALQLLTYGAARGLDTLGSGGPSVPAALRQADLDQIVVESPSRDEATPTAPTIEAPVEDEAAVAEVEVAEPTIEPLPASEAMPPQPPSEIPSAETVVVTQADVEADELDSARSAGFTMEGSSPSEPSEPNFHVIDAPAVVSSTPAEPPPSLEAEAPATPPIEATIPAPPALETPSLEPQAPAAPEPAAPEIGVPDLDSPEPTGPQVATTEELTASELPTFETSAPPPPAPLAPELPTPEPASPVPPPPLEDAPPLDDTWELAPEEPEDTEPVAPPPPIAPAMDSEPAEELATQVIQHDQVEAMLQSAKAPPPVEAPAPVPGGQVAPPADLEGPGSAFADRADPDDPAHDEARRLARLLVSEIKLYNEEAIEEGRKEGNIYGRMREDIDRSRLMYEERVDATVRATSDYFKDELIRTLASGDAAVMGL